MCDINAISAWLLGAEALLVGVVAAIFAAVHDPGSVFGTSTPRLSLALAGIGAVIIALTRANSLLSACFAACSSQASTLRSSILAVIAALGVQAAALGLVIIAPPSIVVAGSSILSALTIQAAAMIVLGGSLTALGACVAATSGSKPSPLTTIASAGAIIAGIVSLTPVISAILSLHPRG